jgi:hypothetical protein
MDPAGASPYLVRSAVMDAAVLESARDAVAAIRAALARGDVLVSGGDEVTSSLAVFFCRGMPTRSISNGIWLRLSPGLSISLPQSWWPGSIGITCPGHKTPGLSHARPGPPCRRSGTPEVAVPRGSCVFLGAGLQLAFSFDLS